MKKFLDEVEKALKPHGKKKRKKVDEWYLKSKLENLGIPVPKQRALSKKEFSFSKKAEKELDQIWDHVWKNAKTHEAASQALFYFGKKKKELTEKEWKILKSWVNKVDNWAHSDYLSDLYSHLLEKYPNVVYPVLERWNKSKNAWKRRASVVSLIYYMTPKRNPPPPEKILPLVKNLLPDKDPYVQKAVGWTLREAHKIYSKKTLDFIEKHVNELSATAFSYATEHFPKNIKERLKATRKEKRNSSK